MKTHKKKKYLIISLVVLVVLFLLFIVPIIINELYKVDEGYITKWGASDVLSFYGSILACIGGVVGVFITLLFSQKQYREDARIRIMPFFTMNQYNDSKYRNLFIDDENYYEEQTDKNCRLIIYSKGEIKQGRRYLTPKQMKKIEADNEYYFTVIKIKNEGFAIGTKVIVGIFKEKDTLENICEEGRFISLQAISKGESVYLGLYLNLEEIKGETNILYLFYSDLSTRRYYQKVEFTIECNKNKILLSKKDTAENFLYLNFKEKKDNGK